MTGEPTFNPLIDPWKYMTYFIEREKNVFRLISRNVAMKMKNAVKMKMPTVLEFAFCIIVLPLFFAAR